MKPVVLYVLDYYLPHRWGVETVFEQIISRTIASGKKVIILTSHFDPNLPIYEKHDDLEIYRVGQWRIWFMVQALFKWAQILKNQQIDLIHTSTYWWAIPASLLAKLFGKKVLITVHEIFAQLWHQYKGWWKWWIYRMFEWLIFQLPFDAFHCVSLYTFNSLRLVYAIPDEKNHCIHNGVDLSFRDPNLVKTEEKNQISELFHLQWFWNLLYFGHTGISKGIDQLIIALPELLQTYPDLQFIFNFIPAKRGVKIRLQLQNLIDTLPSDQGERIRLHFWLEKSELRALISQVDGVIAPSLSEGFWSVHSEVCQMQIPLITTRIASIPEVVSGKVVFIAPKSPESIIQGVKKLKNQIFDPVSPKVFDRTIQYHLISSLYAKLGLR